MLHDLEQMKKNLFVTGHPSSGKTTVIKKVIKLLTVPVKGFYTEEECISGKRVGFLMHTHSVGADDPVYPVPLSFSALPQRTLRLCGEKITT